MELEKEIDALQMGPDGVPMIMEGGGTVVKSGGKKSKKDDDKKMDDDPPGPKPMLPYSSMFVLTSTNP
jgi:voltage-dependent calcium channel N type alpha-1B